MQDTDPVNHYYNTAPVTAKFHTPTPTHSISVTNGPISMLGRSTKILRTVVPVLSTGQGPDFQKNNHKIYHMIIIRLS